MMALLSTLKVIITKLKSTSQGTISLITTIWKPLGTLLTLKRALSSRKKIMEENVYANKLDGDDYFCVIV